MEVKGYLSAGTWRVTSERLEVVSPYDGRPVGAVSRVSADGAIEAARHGQAFRSELTAFARAEILRRTAAAVEDDADGFARSITAEAGTALKEARREVVRAVGFLRVCAEEATRLAGEAIPTDTTAAGPRRLAITRREPVGLVCAITPFNRPLNQVVVKLAPALAANNRVILKPSEKTPLTAVRFVETLLACGLPPRMVSLVTGEPDEVGRSLVHCEYIDMLTFTGSTAVGERLAKAAGMIRMTFELGDSGALVVLGDADLDAAAEAAAAGAFATAGQSCRGVKRIVVEEPVADALVERLTAHAERLVVGDPSDPATDVGTLINERAAVEVAARVEDAVAHGARVVSGGRRRGAQYWPTVLDRVPPTVRLVTEETFGPCAPVIRVRDLEEAIGCVNATRYGLQTGVFTTSLPSALRAADELRVGAVIVNGGPQFESPNIPFGGVKKSGLGREGARFAIEEMSVVKTVVL